MRDVLAVTKALADENRLRVLCAMGGGELCVCQITELLGLAPSTVSKHMSILHQARLVEGRKDGRWMYYRLAESDAVALALAWVRQSLGESQQVVADRKRIKTILKCDPENLCRKQHRS